MPEIRTQRTPGEQLVDELLTLSLLHGCAPTGPVGDRLKATKLLFLAAYETYRQQAKGFNLSFYRYTYGPFTPELYETWGRLEWAGLLSIEPEAEGQIVLTERGHRVAIEFSDEVLSQEQNRMFAQALLRIEDTYANMSTGTLLRRVYAMELTPVGWSRSITVGTVPNHVFLTRVLEEAECDYSLAVSDQRLQSYDLENRTFVDAVASVPLGHTPQSLRLISEALEAEKRGEGRRVSLEETRAKYKLG